MIFSFYKKFQENSLEKYLVTSALPYANGRLHIGHVAGAYLPADIFVRYLRLKEKDVAFICGTDEHGAPISIKADKEGLTPAELVKKYHKKIKSSFEGLNINFDNFSGTARKNHHKLAQQFFLNLYDAGYINAKISEQFYCEHDKRFLADRYVEGICPYCKTDGARGDQCDSCGKLMETLDLIEPSCKICNNKPVIKETKQWFLNLPKFTKQLQKWLKTKDYWKENVYNFINNWLEEGLEERAITRDINWGVPVPLENNEDKVLYVWFDAPIGYISSTKEWAEKLGEPDKWKEYWFNNESKLIHFIGKDNIPFHTIIWPALLMAQKENYNLPYDVPANEYLNIKGQKTSTSKNYAIWVEDYLKYFNGELLRYALALNAPETKDSDFSWDKFQQDVNNDLANVLGNLANRVFTFSKKYFRGLINKPASFHKSSNKLLEEIDKTALEIDDNFKHYKVRKSAKQIIDIARAGNKYFDERKPWKAIKQDKEKVQETLFVCVELLRKISILLTPILPDKMKELRKMMNLDNVVLWKNINKSKDRYKISEIKPLFKKITDKEIIKQKQLLKANLKQKDKKMEHKQEIQFEDFQNMEIRIAKIISAEKIKNADKLLKVELDLGQEKRTVVAGIAKFYQPDKLAGTKVVVLVNLQPRKLFGIKSQGMILAAESENDLSLLTIEKSIPPGSEVH